MPETAVPLVEPSSVSGTSYAGALACLLVVAIATALHPAVAQAHRAPTARDRAEIARAVARGVRGPRASIRIRRVEVSSFGPFATANFDVTFKKGEKPVATSVVLVKAHGHWFETGARDAPNLRPSKAVASDLHLYVTPPDAKFPRPNHTSAGLSQHAIHVIEILAGVLLGVVVVLAVLGRLFGGGGGGFEGEPGTPSGGAFSAATNEPVNRPKNEVVCSLCEGTGKPKCNLCGGNRFIPDDDGGSTSRDLMPCPLCAATGRVGVCTNCHGAGKI